MRGAGKFVNTTRRLQHIITVITPKQPPGHGRFRTNWVCCLRQSYGKCSSGQMRPLVSKGCSPPITEYCRPRYAHHPQRRQTPSRRRGEATGRRGATPARDRRSDLPVHPRRRQTPSHRSAGEVPAGPEGGCPPTAGDCPKQLLTALPNHLLQAAHSMQQHYRPGSHTPLPRGRARARPEPVEGAAR